MVTRYSCLSSAEQNVCLAPLTTPLAFPFLFFYQCVQVVIVAHGFNHISSKKWA
jgi:hypothetical protein